MIKHVLRRFSTLSYTTSKRIQVPSDLFYNTVINVPDYKNFVPLTEESTIVSQVNEQEFYGKLTVNFTVYNGSFVSRVRHNADKSNGLYKVISTSKDNPVLKTLESRWTIKALDENTCQVGYGVDYEFSNRLYQHAASAVMDRIAKGTLDAFEKRAVALKTKAKKPEQIVSPQQETQQQQEDLDEYSEESSYKTRKPGIISKMEKPRKMSGKGEQKKVEELSIIHKLTLLKKDGKLDDLSFYKLSDRILSDIAVKSQILNLCLLQRDGMLTEVHLIKHLKDLLVEGY